MSDTEKEFELELETFRVNAETAAQYFYAFQAIHYLSSRDKDMLNLLNETPMFWNTSIYALRDAMFISLGRVFDKHNQAHTLNRLLEIAKNTPGLFELSSPRWQKHEKQSLIHAVYVPQPKDWQRILRHVKKWRGVYHNNYQSIRDKVFAHRERITSAERTELFKQTSYAELEKLFAFLDALYGALWGLYYNGKKPIIRYRRYSLMQMFAKKITNQRNFTAGERVASDTQSFFESYAKRTGRL